MNQKNKGHSSGFGATVRRWRRNNRGWINRVLVRFCGTTEACRRPLAPDTHRILVVRLNKRLGNVLFLTPMLRSLAATLPAARIDVLIQKPAQKPLLQALPGVDRVLIQESGFWGTLRTVREVRRQRYDLVIDPVGNSISNRMGVALTRARQRMGFASRDQWLRLTHAAGTPESSHQALQSVELLTSTITTPDVVSFDELAVFPGTVDRQAADEHWEQAFGTQAPAAPVIGFFSWATGQKMLPRHWWQEWMLQVHQLIPDATLLEILPDKDAAPVTSDIAHLSLRSLSELAALLSRLDQFVAADSGPMHLAAAAGTPVIGLFQDTSPHKYAPLGRQCVSLEGDELTPEGVARCLAARLA